MYGQKVYAAKSKNLPKKNENYKIAQGCQIFPTKEWKAVKHTTNFPHVFINTFSIDERMIMDFQQLKIR